MFDLIFNPKDVKRLHGIISYKIEVSIAVTVRTSYPATGWHSSGIEPHVKKMKPLLNRTKGGGDKRLQRKWFRNSGVLYEVHMQQMRNGRNEEIRACACSWKTHRGGGKS